MGKTVIASIEAKKFDFEEFLSEIRKNLSRELNTDFIPKYMEKCGDEYIDIISVDNEGLSPSCINKDILYNDRILYISFIYNHQTYGEERFLCGDGQELDINTTYHGDVIHEDCGYLMESKGGMLIFKKAEYGGRIEGHFNAKLINNAGDLEYIMQEFLYKYTY
ncbi:MAG: hypothetical protein ACRC7N_06495 [Clostridium sp.]